MTVSNDGISAIIARKPRENVQLELRNLAILGSATISKQVVGDAAGAATDQSFAVTAYITHPDGKQM